MWSGNRARCLSSAALSLSLCFLDFFLDLLRDEPPWGLLGWAQSVSRGKLRHVVGAGVATSPCSQSRPPWPRSLLTSARGSWALGGSNLGGSNLGGSNRGGSNRGGSNRGGRWVSVPASGPGVGSKASRPWGALSFPLMGG